MSTIRLDKLVANLGYGSRRDVQTLVRSGRITLRGLEVDSADRRLTRDEARELVIDGAAIDPLPCLVLMVHKPIGMTCSHKEAGPLVYSLFPDRWRRRDPPLSTIGRLDKETSGLVLVTDDGALLHRIISPKAQVAKRYRVQLARPLRGDEAEAFTSGRLMLDGEEKPLLPAALEVLGPTECCVTITEGRYHQVRRMFAALGNHVAALHREAIGGLTLPDGLSAGSFREISDGECASLTDLR